MAKKKTPAAKPRMGRPPLGKLSLTTTVAVKLDAATARRLEARAAAEGVSVGKLIRDAVLTVYP